MRSIFLLLAFGLALPISSVAQSCSTTALPEAATSASSVRQRLHQQAVAENDPKIPAQIAADLGQLQNALADAAVGAFACAETSATAADLEKTLAAALHANLSDASETALVTRGGKDLGAYGSDLAVQVFPLSNSPRYVEVNFRYGIECGDDNLLLVFEAGPVAGSVATTVGWHEVMRWGAPNYTRVGDAYGDFVLLTPLSGFPGQRNWRFVVAHGQPSCGPASSPSHFDLDVLEPGAEPAQPQIIFHLRHEYVRSQVPRLASTEDTMTFELDPPEMTARTAKTPARADVYRFHIGKDNQVLPLTSPENASAK